MKTQKKMRPAAVEFQWKVALTKRGRTVSQENLVRLINQQEKKLGVRAL